MIERARDKSFGGLRRLTLLLLAATIAAAAGGCQTVAPSETTGALGLNAATSAAGETDSAQRHRGLGRALPRQSQGCRRGDELRPGRCATTASARRRWRCSSRRRSRIPSTWACSAPMAAPSPMSATTSRRSRCSIARIRPISPTGAFCRCRALCSTRWAATRRRSATMPRRLKIVPDEPSVLSNLGLSYALSKDLVRAEATLRRAAAQSKRRSAGAAESRLVVGLQGRFAEAEGIARADLPSDEAAANVAYLRADAGAAERLEGSGRERQAQGPRARRLTCSSRASGPKSLGTVVGKPSCGRARSTRRFQFICITLIAAGPRITTNSTGRKNRIIGTVSLGGRPAAFFSASDMRMSRFSCAMTRSVCAIGVP